MALAWVAIFAVALLVVSGRDRIAAGWSDVTGALVGSDQQVVGGDVAHSQGR